MKIFITDVEPDSVTIMARPTGAGVIGDMVQIVTKDDPGFACLAALGIGEHDWPVEQVDTDEARTSG